MVTQPTRWIGQSVTRLEDPPLVTGRGRYAGDISFPHQLHMRVVRSHVASGRIVAIDTGAAKAVPGVFAVWSAADIPDAPPIDFREGRIEKLEPYRQPVLATDRVRYVGDPIAAVFAEDPYIAEDAADLVTVDIEELPVLLHAQAEPGEFSPGRSTEAAIVRQGYGDLDAAFRAAHAIVELELSVGRHSGVPIETRGAIGRYDAARDMLELHGAAKIPHANRNLLARMLKRAPSAISLHESHVGGGFGIRGELYPEDVLVLIAAMRLGRPVKWIEDRREHLMCAAHSRQQTHKLRAAVDREGHILAIDDEFWHDQGAYLRTHAIRVAMMICGSCRAPIGCRPIARSVTSGSPTRRRPPPTGRPGGSRHVHSRANDGGDRLPARHGFDRGPPAQHDHQGGDALLAPARGTRRRDSTTTPVTIWRCSTRCSRRPTGKASTRNARGGVPRASLSASARRCSWRRAGSAPPTA